MDTGEKPTHVVDDVVVSLEYVLTVDGELLDSSDENDPLEFIQGHQNVIPGLERAIYGMSIGESKIVDILAKDAYGLADPEGVIELPRDQFPEDIPLELGIQLQVRDMDGDMADAHIIAISKSSVTLDFNHPLAGKDLHFDVKVTDLRPATAEELEHGHVHGEDYDEDEDEYYDGEEDYFEIIDEDEENDNHRE